MHQVQQTRFGEKGNCFQACIASLFELPIEVVPDFVNEYDLAWLGQFDSWLAPMNLLASCHAAAIPNSVGCAEDLSTQFGLGASPKGYAIATIRLIGGSGRLHAVIYKDGKFLWDPNPERDVNRRFNIRMWTVLQVLDPAKAVPDSFDKKQKI